MHTLSRRQFSLATGAALASLAQPVRAQTPAPGRTLYLQTCIRTTACFCRACLAWI
jgi:hypothetical protein